MIGFPAKRRRRSQGDVSASLLGLVLLSSLLLTLQAAATVWHLNDTWTEGDCFTRSAGNDLSGDGTAATPFRSLARAIESMKDGDTVLLDTGDYDLSLPLSGPEAEKKPALTFSKLTLKGAGADKTFLRASGRTGLAFFKAREVRLQDFCISGGDSSLLLEHCSGFVITRVHTTDSQIYGMLIQDCEDGKIESCQTEKSLFQGIQFRRSHQNSLSKHISRKNVNGGICLEASGENKLTECQSIDNGKSGFYLLRKSLQNRVEKCLASGNKFVGFYVDSRCSGNLLIGNQSRQNERGFTLKGAPDNALLKNRADSNRGSGFWIKDKSNGGRYEGNQAELNLEAGFVLAPDSPPAVFTDNQSRKNKAPDQLGTAAEKSKPVLLSDTEPSR